MREAYGLENEDLLWAGTNFFGGIAGYQRAPCGAVSASAVCLGLRQLCSSGDEEKVQEEHETARRKARELVQSFAEKFGDIICLELIGADFSIPGEFRKFFDAGMGEEKCNKYVRFCVEKLYELDEG
jgi:C_GCAxxG_C_C family probable redox protein